MILAWILGEIELVIQVPTISSHRIQAWIFDGVDTNGDDKVKEPLVKPSLFWASKAFF